MVDVNDYIKFGVMDYGWYESYQELLQLPKLQIHLENISSKNWIWSEQLIP